MFHILWLGMVFFGLEYFFNLWTDFTLFLQVNSRGRWLSWKKRKHSMDKFWIFLYVVVPSLIQVWYLWQSNNNYFILIFSVIFYQLTGVILTAAHCIDKREPYSLKIRAGEWDTQTNGTIYHRICNPSLPSDDTFQFFQFQTRSFRIKIVKCATI